MSSYIFLKNFIEIHQVSEDMNCCEDTRLKYENQFKQLTYSQGK